MTESDLSHTLPDALAPMPEAPFECDPRCWMHPPRRQRGLRQVQRRGSDRGTHRRGCRSGPGQRRWGSLCSALLVAPVIVALIAQSN
jgi:hypothetical protein